LAWEVGTVRQQAREWGDGDRERPRSPRALDSRDSLWSADSARRSSLRRGPRERGPVRSHPWSADGPTVAYL